jgi:hypothetical protein
VSLHDGRRLLGDEALIGWHVLSTLILIDSTIRGQPPVTTMGGGSTHSHSDYPEHNFSPGAKWIKNLTRERTGNFSGGHFQDVNLSSVLFTHRLDDSKHVQLQRWSAPGITKPSFQEALKQDFQPAKKGESIGPSCE